MNKQVKQRIDRIRSEIKRAEIKQGYYLEGDDGQPWPEKEWCWPCAEAVAFHYRRRRGMRELRPWECWSGDDSLCRCSGCDVALHTGGLTRYGVDEEIGLVEVCGPEGSAVELIMVLDALSDDDPRKPQVQAWLEQAVANAEPAPPPRTMRDLLP